MSSRPAPDPRDPRPLTGEPLALDLLNTRWRGREEPNDLLKDRAGYEVWLSSAGLADRCTSDGVALAATRLAREAIADVLADPAAYEQLNEVLAHGGVRRRLTADGPAETVEADSPAWLAAWLAAADCLRLLADTPDRIRRCAHPDCILYFLDDSQNGRRRWCSMATCGNRAKAARHYARNKEA